jgi:hypothetical protein
MENSESDEQMELEINGKNVEMEINENNEIIRKDLDDMETNGSNENTEKNLDEIEINEDNELREEDFILTPESNRKKWSEKGIEDLLEELSEEELENLELEQKINEEELTEEISKLYHKLCRQEGILFEGKRGMMEIYYEFGKRFEEKLNVLMNDYQKKKTAINKLIEEIIKGGINHNKRNIIRKSEKARKIYKIISKEGGKEKIRKLKNLNSEEYMKFSFNEIEEWRNTIENL